MENVKVKGDTATFLYKGKIVTGKVARVNKKSLDMQWFDGYTAFSILIPFKNIIR